MPQKSIIEKLQFSLRTRKIVRFSSIDLLSTAPEYTGDERDAACEAYATEEGHEEVTDHSSTKHHIRNLDNKSHNVFRERLRRQRTKCSKMSTIVIN